MKIEFIHEIKNLLSSSKKISIFSHKNPDGDAIGSGLALYHYLKKNHEVKFIVPNDFPDFLRWMPNSKDIAIYERCDKEAVDLFIKESDLLFLLDFNTLGRIDMLGERVTEANGTKILIDHHQQPDEFDYVFSDVSMPATCQMMYHFLMLLEGDTAITPKISECIYTGIMTDTGSFRFPNTSPETHRVIAHLLELGADKEKIHTNVYDSSPLSRFKVLGQAMRNLRVIYDYHTAYITLTSEELKRCRYQKGDTEGIVNYGLGIKNVKFAAIFIEDEEQKIIKISLRSKGNFDVNQFSRNHCNGGGHINAAGGRSELSLEQTVENFIQNLALYQEELKK